MYCKQNAGIIYLKQKLNFETIKSYEITFEILKQEELRTLKELLTKTKKQQEKFGKTLHKFTVRFYTLQLMLPLTLI